MIVALWLVVSLQLCVIAWLGYDKLKRGGFGPKALSTGHGLQRVYYKNGSYTSSKGWAWQCECGVGQLIDGYNNPSEERALGAWKNHRAMYDNLALETTENAYKVLYEDKQAELVEFKKTCYCKDIH